MSEHGIDYQTPRRCRQQVVSPQLDDAGTIETSEREDATEVEVVGKDHEPFRARPLEDALVGCARIANDASGPP